MAVSRQFDGCIMLDAGIDQDDPNSVVMTEEWQSKAHHLAYLKFRTEDDTLETIGSMLAADPIFTYIDLADA